MEESKKREVPWSPPDISREEKEAAISVINSGWLTQGKETKTFEKELAEYLGCKHVVVMNNGTASLISSMYAHGIRPGDEVIVPTLTFIASVNSILAVGAQPVLVDSDLKTRNVSVDLVKEKINKKTKAIMPVDVAGMSVDIKAFRELAEEKDLILIEDAAQGIGGEYKNKKIGSFGHTTIFSFHMAKLVSTVEGGCVATNDEEIARKCDMIRNHGMQARYDYGVFGLNFRITDIQSAIGRAQLKKADKYVELRNKFAKLYQEGLGGKVEYQEIPDSVNKHPQMLGYGVLTNANRRDDIIKHLNENGIGTRICWVPTHQQAHHNTIFKERFPNAENIASRIINLPMGNALVDEDINYVISKLREVL